MLGWLAEGHRKMSRWTAERRAQRHRSWAHGWSIFPFLPSCIHSLKRVEYSAQETHDDRCNDIYDMVLASKKCKFYHRKIYTLRHKDRRVLRHLWININKNSKIYRFWEGEDESRKTLWKDYIIRQNTACPRRKPNCFGPDPPALKGCLAVCYGFPPRCVLPAVTSHLNTTRSGGKRTYPGFCGNPSTDCTVCRWQGAWSL